MKKNTNSYRVTLKWHGPEYVKVYAYAVRKSTSGVDAVIKVVSLWIDNFFQDPKFKDEAKSELRKLKNTCDIDNFIADTFKGTPLEKTFILNSVMLKETEVEEIINFDGLYEWDFYTDCDPLDDGAM